MELLKLCDASNFNDEDEIEAVLRRVGDAGET